MFRIFKLQCFLEKKNVNASSTIDSVLEGFLMAHLLYLSANDIHPQKIADVSFEQGL